MARRVRVGVLGSGRSWEARARLAEESRVRSQNVVVVTDCHIAEPAGRGAAGVVTIFRLRSHSNDGGLW